MTKNACQMFLAGVFLEIAVDKPDILLYNVEYTDV